MNISVTSYSYYQYIAQKKMTMLDTLQKTVELGIPAIELIELDGAGDYGLQTENAHKLRAEADRLGLPIISYTIGAELNQDTPEARSAEVERLCRQLDLAKILGAPVMRHDVTRKAGSALTGIHGFVRALPVMADMAREVTAYAETLGIRTCSENHGYVFQDADRVERFYEAVGHDNYGVLLDIGNMMCADEDPVTTVSRLAPYAIHVHAKDMIKREKRAATLRCFETRAANFLVPVALGEGDVDIPRCLAILKKNGYQGYVSIEYEGAHDCIEGIKFGHTYLSSL